MIHIPSQVVTLQAAFMAKAKERSLHDCIYKSVVRSPKALLANYGR